MPPDKMTFKGTARSDDEGNGNDDERDETKREPKRGGTLTMEDVERIVNERMAREREEHDEQVASLRMQIPQTLVPNNGGGPGVDNHQRSWSLAEQEAANRGETLEHWE